ncbi:MAG TPA: glycosyl hydrolase family 18 protein [Bacteroidota bacterium]|nr:glycosyl hydrolase family 18 protein [Bacteroidota bacterium]
MTRWLPLKLEACVLAAICLLAFCSQAPAQYSVIGYYPTWLNGTIPANQVHWDVITHVNHAFAWPLANGTITTDQMPVDTAVINSAHRAGRKILISLGGASQSGAFAGIAADSALRKTFAANLLAYVSTNRYDGADLDWESPASSADRANEVALVHAIRDAFSTVNTPLLLTMAIGATAYSGQWRDYASLLAYVDWFNVMTYDFHGSWSSHAGHNAPLYASSGDNDGSVDQSIFYLQRTRGIPASRLVLGLPFYGQQFSASKLYGPSTGGGAMLYSDIAPLIDAGWSAMWDSVAMVPYLVAPRNNAVVSYDDSLSLTLKCAYAKSHSLAGVMIWALGEDMVNGTQPLMTAVGIAMAATSDIAEQKSAGVPSGASLDQNYPNPFNPKTVISGQWTADSDVRLVVYDLLGREIAVLANGRYPAGRYTFAFDATNLSSGVYLYRLTAGAHSAVRKMLVLR